MNSSALYYYVDSRNQAAGPETAERLGEMLRSGLVQMGTLVVEVGGTVWKALDKVLPGIEPVPAGPPPVGGPPAALAPVSTSNDGLPQLLPTPVAPAPVAAASATVASDARSESGWQDCDMDETVDYPGFNRAAFITGRLILDVAIIKIGVPMALFSAGISGLLVVLLCIVVTNLILAARRLMNIGWPVRWSFLYLIPGIHFLVELALAVLPPGFRQNRKMDIKGWICLTICLVKTVCFCLAMATSVWALKTMRDVADSRADFVVRLNEGLRRGDAKEAAQTVFEVRHSDKETKSWRERMQQRAESGQAQENSNDNPIKSLDMEKARREIEREWLKKYRNE